MQAIILAAGMGKRLKELTHDNTKCMVKVNGVTLIDRMLHQIDNQHLSRIIIVIGYEGQKLIDYIGTLDIQTPIMYINNPIFDKTNNIYSLALAKKWLVKEDTLLFESDLIFEDAVLDALITDPRETLALVDKYESWMDGTCVKLAEDDTIESFVPGKKFKYNEIKEYYKTVNIYKFSKHFSETHYVPFLDAYQSALGKNEYYEQVLRVITMLDEPEIKAKRLDGQRWYEIDDIQDLDIAESIFAPEEDERVKLIQSRCGGYWRYPKMLDFSCTVNPYFPSKKMRDEIRTNFDTLLSEYPSGMRVNSLLAARNFNVHQENILVGNDTTELLKSLMGYLNGVVGFIHPSYNEYPGFNNLENSVDFMPDNKDFSYTADDIIAYFANKSFETLILSNPDNVSANYIPKAEIIRLIDWTKEKGIRIVIDETFADFADETDNTLIEQSILENNSHLYVMKSISKSCGVPGIRLGVLASGDKETITKMKEDALNWNINSFGEFYMQIEEKYKKDYVAALIKIREERERFQTELAKIEGIRVIPSQANFVTVELEKGISSKELLKRLLIKHNLLISELSMKTNDRNYLLLAIRNTKENDMLVKAMKVELEA